MFQPHHAAGTRGIASGGVSKAVASSLALVILTSSAVLGIAPDAGSAEAGSRSSRPGHIERISVAHDGGDTDGLSETPAISGDGSVVAFTSFATNIVSGDSNAARDVFVFHRDTGTYEMASVSSDEVQTPRGFDVLDEPSISRDGRYVAFVSHAPNLVAGDKNCSSPSPGGSLCGRDVFVRDLVAGTTERVSLGVGGRESNGPTMGARISGNGRFVTYMSEATNLVAGYTTRCGLPCGDVYVFDRETRKTELISVTPSGGNGSDTSRLPGISNSGRYVAFASWAKDLVPGMESSPLLIYLRDRQTGTTELISKNNAGVPANEVSSHTGHPTVSDDGNLVVFTSGASNLVPNKKNNTVAKGRTVSIPGDVYVRDRAREVTQRVSVSSAGAEGIDSSGAGEPALDASGRFVVFGGESTNLAPSQRGPDSFVTDSFIHDRSTGITNLLSVNARGDQANLLTFEMAISADGRFAVFSSLATNLDKGADPGPPGGDMDVFIQELRPAEGVWDLSAVKREAGIDVRGDAAFSGAVMTAASDGLDAGPGADLGAEITGAEILYRPALKDLLVRLTVESLAGVRAPGPIGRRPIPKPLPGSPSDPLEGVVVQAPSDPGLPPIVYGLTMAIDDGENVNVVEVRAGRVGAAGPEPTIELYRCTGGDPCGASFPLDGGFGTTGEEIVVSVPVLKGFALRAREGLEVHSIRAYAGVGTTTTGPRHLLDEVVLPSASIPQSSVQIGRGAVAEEIAFDTVAALFGGSFAATLDDADLESRVWARSCLGDACSEPRSTEVLGASGSTPTPTPDTTATPLPTETVVPGITSIGFTDDSSTTGQYSDPTRFAARLADADGPLEHAELIFTLTGQQSSPEFTAITDENGVAAVNPTLAEKPGAYQLTVRYEGDDDHQGSADSTIFVVEKEDSALELIVENHGQSKTLRARLSDLDSSADGLLDKRIDFYSDGQLIGSEQTDPNGVASLPVPPQHRGSNRLYEATFAPDDFYRGSSAQTSPPDGAQGGGAAGASRAQQR